MTREIKFRAYDLANKKMYSWGDLKKDPQLLLALMLTGDHELCPFEIIQFTGLKDKNGAEIYEGDLISWGNGDPCEVRFVEQGIQWEGEGKFYVNFWAVVNPNPLGFDRSIYPLEDRSGDVIGNIYENAELLEAVK